MTSRPDSSPSEPSAAERVFLAHLERIEAGEEPDVEALYAEHPGLELELRELVEAEAWARGVGLQGRTRRGTLTGEDLVDEDANDALLGELFHDKYRIVRRIGRGGFGTVYEAIDERGAGNAVAIKVLSGAAAQSAVHQQSFKDEARRATRLSHPNVVDWKVFDATDDGVPYFVMELVQGEKFDQVLAREGRLEPNRAARLLLQILDALRAAHHLSETESILHLDLKPENLFLVGDQGGRGEQIKVIDFGIGQYIGDEEVGDEDEPVAPDAEAGGRSTLSFASRSNDSGSGSARSSRIRRSRGCTPEYASPEQVAHVMDMDDILPLDGRSDLYSLGVLGFQMLTGRLPFEPGRNRLEVLRMHLETPAPRLASLGARAPKRLAHFIDRCLEKDRERRWPDTRAAHEYLRDFVHPPVWKTVAKVVAPIVVAGVALGAWSAANRETSIPVARLATSEGIDLDSNALALGTARTSARLHLALPAELSGGSDALAEGRWRVEHAADGAPATGWSAAWDEGGNVVIEAPDDLEGRVAERLVLALEPRRLVTRPFTALWIGAGTWTVPAIELGGRSISECVGLGIDPFGVSLDLWIEGEARRDVALVRARAGDGAWLTLSRGTGTAERERYRLALEDARLATGRNDLALEVTDVAGAAWTREVTLDVVRDPLELESASLVDVSAPEDADGAFPRCNRIGGQYVISPRTRAALALELSRAADVSWTVFLDGSDQPALRGAMTGRQRVEAVLELADLRDGQPYEGRLRLVAREAAYVVHASGSTRGVTEAEVPFRYENTEPRFTAEWVDERGARALADTAVFTRAPRSEVQLTRETAVPMKLEVAWWREGHPGEVRVAETAELRNAQTQQTSVAVELESDGVYALRVRSFRYDTSANDTVDSPDVELAYRLVLDRAAPPLRLAGVSKDVTLDSATLPEALSIEVGEPSERDQPPVELAWSLTSVGAREWSARGTLTGLGAREAARLPFADHWRNGGAPDGPFRLELDGVDAAGNVLDTLRTDFEVDLRGPVVALEEPVGIGKWHPDPATGRWRVRVRASDPNGLARSTTCVLESLDGSVTLPIALVEAGGARTESVLEGSIALPHSLSEASVRIEVTAHDRFGSATDWTSDALTLPTIARRRPARVVARVGSANALELGPMRLVTGNAGYPYVFGGRGDAVENSAFVQAGLPPFHDGPRRARPRSWQLDYAPGAIEDFYLDEREVSVAEFLAFLDDPGGYRTLDVPGSRTRRDELRARLAAEDGDAPVAGVTWYEANAFARWAGKRLPSWVEWEFAARDGGSYRVTPDDARAGGITGLFAGVREWCATPAPSGSGAAHEYPEPWARANPGLLLDPAPETDSPARWIVGAADGDVRRDFAVADYLPRDEHLSTVGFRCAASLDDVLAHLGAAPEGQPVFEETTP